uniref:EF-hand domain-containing protein n=1 Tax=Timema poppense TaxID=170557 RepID=A0A7R9GSN8_TIMPO|nr:unnamed protein product [Timema poppensis]
MEKLTWSSPSQISPVIQWKIFLKAIPLRTSQWRQTANCSSCSAPATRLAAVTSAGMSFRELCTGFDIPPRDADVIFRDLDHDGDGRVSLDDFAWGFRDFLSGSGTSRRASVHQGEEIARQASTAWASLIAGVGQDTVHHFLNTR